MMVNTFKEDIKNLTTDQLVAWLQSLGIQSYRAIQILKWIYQHQEDHFEKMTDLGQEIRQRISERFETGRLGIIEVKTSEDGAKKILFKLEDGNRIESVLIPEKSYHTLCISSQVGCSQGCRFCLTARGGCIRNLTCGEIIAQVRDILTTLDSSQKISNIVLMGMGEPLANYQNVVNALSVITNRDYGLGFSERRVTVSTAGLVPKLIDLSRDTNVNIAVSLNATTNQTRNMLMPINRKYPIEDLLDTCSRIQLPKGRKITMEYIVIKGINDTLEDAKRLAKLLRPIRCKINLIPFNPYKDCDLKRPDEARIQAFREFLTKEHYTVMVRYSKGQDISAACGQLATHRCIPDEI